MGGVLFFVVVLPIIYSLVGALCLIISIVAVNRVSALHKRLLIPKLGDASSYSLISIVIAAIILSIADKFLKLDGRVAPNIILGLYTAVSIVPLSILLCVKEHFPGERSVIVAALQVVLTYATLWGISVAIL